MKLDSNDYISWVVQAKKRKRKINNIDTDNKKNKSIKITYIGIPLNVIIKIRHVSSEFEIKQTPKIDILIMIIMII